MSLTSIANSIIHTENELFADTRLGRPIPRQNSGFRSDSRTNLRISLSVNRSHGGSSREGGGKSFGSMKSSSGKKFR